MEIKEAINKKKKQNNNNNNNKTLFLFLNAKIWI